MSAVCLDVIVLLAGCSGGMIAPLTISPQEASVRLGSTLTLIAEQLGEPVRGAIWTVNGGLANGSIDPNGVYSPPKTIPASNITVTCQALGQTATATIVLLNPTPSISQVTPATAVQLTTPVVIAGNGFVSGSQVLVGGVAVPTTFLDSGHLSATMLIADTSVTSLTLAISNPSPGAIVSTTFVLPVAIAPLSIAPQSPSVRLRSTIALTGMQLGGSVPGGTWSVVGAPANGSINSGGIYSPPSSIPPSNVSVTYQALGQTATNAITILNPVPSITQIIPARMTELSTPIVVAGSGFVFGSELLVNGVIVPTTLIDGSHLSATVSVSNISVESLALTVSNPTPGPIVSSPATLPVSIAPLVVSPQGASVRVGSTLALTAAQQGARVSAAWSVSGGPANGSIDSNGVYSPPPTISVPSVTVTCQALGQTVSTTITLLNPAPVIAQVTPSTLIQISTPITVMGMGFVNGSQILIGGISLATTFIDGQHLSGTVVAPSVSVTSLAVSVANPSPGPIVSAPLAVPVAIAPLTISPQGASVRIGATLALSGLQQGASLPGGVWSVVGGAANGSISQSGLYTPPLSVPSSNVTVTYQAVGQTATSSVTILNPTPTISQISPGQLSELSTYVTVAGSGFVRGSQMLINGNAIATTAVDSNHLTATVAVPSIAVQSLTVVVSNPNPGALVSSPVVLPVSIAPLDITPQGGSVRLGSTLSLAAQQSGEPVIGAVWSVNGGGANGSIDTNGVYTPPPTLPASTTTVTCQALGQTATSAIEVLNPLPFVSGITPTTLTGLSTLVTVSGSGFVSASQIVNGGEAVPTTYVDSSHLSATLLISNSTITSLSLAVSNPAPGAVMSETFVVPVAVPPLSISPAALSGGNVTITASIAGLPTNSVLTLDGVSLATVSATTGSITAMGYLPYWHSGSVTVAVAPNGGGSPFAQLDVPITPTAVSYDVAARFAMQAGFGPRHDIIEHIQQVGLSSFVDEQLQSPLDTYAAIGNPPHLYMQNVVNNDTQLRLRTAWAFQSFMPGKGIFLQESTLPWEQTLEAHAFGNFRQILLDATSDPNITTLLDLPGNAASANANVHPNQNFARELLQLFSIGTVMLNDDGTVQTDSSGNPIPAYGQDTILDISRAFTGWNYGPIVNPAFSFYGIDYTQKLVPTESQHDEGAKTIFGNIQLAAGQTATEDRDQVLDAVFQHQNVPPFISRRLIQRFVKSNPSSAYIARISAVFKDDGQGVRGDLAAVIKAILLDPEARAGDSVPSDDDGFMQDPLFAELFAMELMDIDSTDDNAAYYPGDLGEPIWFPETVFAYYSPDYVIPGTRINSPESQLLTTTLIVQRNQFLWGMINGPQPGFDPWGATWLWQTFPTVPALLDALNHIAYHGNMPSYQQTTMANYCGALADQQSQLRCTLFLALAGSSYTVVH